MAVEVEIDVELLKSGVVRGTPWAGALAFPAQSEPVA
jgi:hypothetical protein